MSKYITMKEFDFKKAKKLPHSEVDLVVVDLGAVSYTHLTLPTTPYV